MNINIFKQACKITTPIFFGYIAIGIPFGLMIVNAGYPWWIAPFMSVFMFAGAGQYIAVGLFATGATLPTIIITELFVNIRHIVYGLSLITKTKYTGKWKPYIIFGLTDETYALLCATDLPKKVEPGSFFGTIALLDHFYWILGGVIGALAYNILQSYNLAQYLNGVDFALTALFAVILTGQIQKSKDFMPPLTGFITATVSVLLFSAGLLSSTNVILVAIILGIATIVLVRARQFYNEKNITVSAKAFVLVVLVALILVATIITVGLLKSKNLSLANATTLQSSTKSLTLTMALFATLASALTIFLERLFPFALFSKKDPPELISFIEKYIPSMIIAILIIYCLKDVPFTQAPYGIPNISAIIVAVVAQLLLKNPMVSIFGSTILYMFLQRTL